MKRFTLLFAFVMLFTGAAIAQDDYSNNSHSLYEIPPRMLIDMPTAGTLRRADFDLGVRLYPEGGAVTYTDIGLSNRLMIGISYGGEQILSSDDPNWNSRIEFNVKFRVIDELEYFPAVSVGFTSQGYGAWLGKYDRYTYKSRGFYGVVSRSFYFYQWTAGWHGGVNYTQEHDVDRDDDINLFFGFDATFRYDLAFLMEFDAALNDNKSSFPSGKGRGYLNMSLKWLFNKNLELEAVLKDLMVNRRESDTFTREIRITFIDSF